MSFLFQITDEMYQTLLWHLLSKLGKSWKLTDEDLTAQAKSKMPVKYPNNITTNRFVRNAQEIIDKDSRKSINVIAKVFKVSRHSIGIIVHGDPLYKLNAMRRGKFMSETTQDNSLICAK